MLKKRLEKSVLKGLPQDILNCNIPGGNGTSKLFNSIRGEGEIFPHSSVHWRKSTPMLKMSHFVTMRMEYHFVDRANGRQFSSILELDGFII